MIKIKIISLGKIKEQYFCDAMAEYHKRLSGYCSFENIKLQTEPLPDKPSKKEIEKALYKEAERIIRAIPENAYVYAMCIEGKKISSEDFAKDISTICTKGQTTVFIIGSSYGLHETVKQRADNKFSLSEMTFPHNLAHIMLLEQIYRAFKINEGGTYHK